jgi:hypothetical protein
MKLEDVSSLKHCYNEKEVNECLKKGYKIIKVIQTRYKTPEFEEVRVMHILGK